METANTCYICQNSIQSQKRNRIAICDSCTQEYPFLAEGFQTNWNSQELPDDLSELGNGIGWYPLAGFESYASLTQDGQEFAWLEIGWEDSPEPDIALEELEQAIRAFGIERSLTYLLSHELHTSYINEIPHISTDNSGLPVQMFRFAAGFIMTLDGELDTSALQSPENSIIDAFPIGYREIIQSLHNVMAAFSSMDYLREKVGVNPSKEHSDRLLVSSAVQNRELVVSRTAFYKQYLQAMERQYTPFQVEFHRHYDIDILDCVKWSENLVSEMETWFQDTLITIIKYQNSCIRVAGGYLRARRENMVEDANEYKSTEEYKRLRYTTIANWNILIQSIRNQFWLTKTDIQSAAEATSTGYFDRFLDKMATEIGTVSLESPYAHNAMDEAPLIKLKNRYLLPYIPRLTYALSQRFYYLLTDKELDRNLGDSWGDVIELWALNRLSRILSDDQYEHSVDYEHPEIGDGEIDILVKVNSTILVIEVKSKRLRAKSRTGALDEVRADVAEDEGIGKAVSQVDDAISVLKDVENVDAIDELPFSVAHSDIERYESMVITSTQYDQLATRMFPLLFENRENEDLPYVCSIYDVEAIVEILSGEELIRYVSERRGELKKRRAIAGGDEIDFLEAFKADVLRESAYSFPSKEEVDLYDVSFMRSISNIDAGVHTALGMKYGLYFEYPIAIW